MLRWPLGAIPMFAALLLGTACSSGAAQDRPDEGSTAGTEQAVTVFAAASLTEAFGALAQAFTRETQIAVTLNLGPSSSLAAQILQGAPADVFAPADEATMGQVSDGVGTEGGATVFATNRLQILVAPGNPLGIDDLHDLSNPEVLVVTGAQEVPIGRYTAQVLDRAGVRLTPRSLEESVKGVVTKVVLGEADAGIVYRSDVLAAGEGADGVDIPDELNVVARYPIAVPAGAPHPAAGAAFVSFVRSPAGRAILDDHGFGPP